MRIWKPRDYVSQRILFAIVVVMSLLRADKLHRLSDGMIKVYRMIISFNSIELCQIHWNVTIDEMEYEIEIKMTQQNREKLLINFIMNSLPIEDVVVIIVVLWLLQWFCHDYSFHIVHSLNRSQLENHFHFLYDKKKIIVERQTHLS